MEQCWINENCCAASFVSSVVMVAYLQKYSGTAVYASGNNITLDNATFHITTNPSSVHHPESSTPTPYPTSPPRKAQPVSRLAHPHHPIPLTHITAQPIPYIALSTPRRTWYQSASAMMAASSLACAGATR